MTSLFELVLRPVIWIAEFNPDAFTVFTFLMMVAASEIGYRRGRRTAERRHDGSALRDSIGFITGGMHALFAFLLSTTFSLAAERFELRGQSILAEANAIGTFWVQASTTGDEAKLAIRATLRDYVQMRIAAATDIRSDADVARWEKQSQALQARIETSVLHFVHTSPSAVAVSVLGAYHEIVDRAALTDWNLAAGVPRHVLRLLLVVAVLSVGAMGYQFGLGRNRQFFVTTLLLVTWTATLLLVLDINAAHWGGLRGDVLPLRKLLASWGPGV